MTDRQKLLAELYDKFGIGAFMYQDDVADFILEDRKRTVAPLVEYKKEHGDASCGVKLGFTFSVFTAIDETIKLAGETT